MKGGDLWLSMNENVEEFRRGQKIAGHSDQSLATRDGHLGLFRDSLQELGPLRNAARKLPSKTFSVVGLHGSGPTW